MASTSGYRALVFMALILLASDGALGMRGKQQQQAAAARPCDEIYVVGEGETLHTISAKCGDPFILEENPQIQDSDDVHPGLVIRITPYVNSRKLLLR